MHTTGNSTATSISLNWSSIDVLRAVAAISVVLHHCAQQLRPSIDSHIWGALLEHLGAWAVSSFFILSGLCIHWAQASKGGGPLNRREFIWRRFRRIYPAFFVSVIVCFFYAPVAKSNLINEGSLEDVVLHLTLLSSFFVDSRGAINNVLWSIVVECHFYLVYALLWRHFCSRRSFRWLMGFALAVSAFTYAASFLLHEAGPERVMIQSSFLASWWTWCLGAWIANRISAGLPRWEPSSWVLLWVVCFGGSLLIGFLPQPFGLQARRFLMPWLHAGWILAFLVLARTWDVPLLLRELGAQSYSTYLFHGLAIAVAVELFAGRPLGFMFFAVLVTLILSRLAYIMFERPFFGMRASLPINEKGGDYAIQKGS